MDNSYKEINIDNCCEIGKHEFIDKYDESEEIPAGVLNMASNELEPEGAVMTLNAGKLHNKKYVLSYCKNCGYRINRT
jgi:hypothetical protein